MQPPPTQYVERDGISIAYQVAGDGPVDMLVAPGFISHLDLQWTHPRYARFLSRLASFTRLIIYDKPGTGLSDPIPHLPTLEERGADIEAVLDAAGSERAVLLGISEGGPSSVVLAATRPERIISLILYGTFAVFPGVAPEAYSPEAVQRHEAMLHGLWETLEHWGDGARLSDIFVPSAGELEQRTYGIFARAAASPRMARALIETAVQIDVRDVLPSVHVPTLVLHVDGDRSMPVEAGRLLADGIPGGLGSELADEGRRLGGPDSKAASDLPGRQALGAKLADLLRHVVISHRCLLADRTDTTVFNLGFTAGLGQLVAVLAGRQVGQERW